MAQQLSPDDINCTDGREPTMLERYLAGYAGTAERERMERWLDSNPHAAMVLGIFLDGITKRREQPPDRYAFLEWVRKHIREGDGTTSAETPWDTARRPLRERRWIRAAWPPLTAVAATLALAAGWYAVSRRMPVGTSVTTYVTAAGQRANITLSDGSTVALNVGSRLDVPVGYANGNRTVRLSGEALFTVSAHSGTPFMVIVGGTQARVLGTNFVARHYADDSAATIAVRSGKVSVRSSVVTAGQEVRVSRNGAVTQRATDPALFSFASGVLMLDNVPLPRAIPELDRWYNADVRLGDASLETRRVSGNIPAGSLTDLAALLELTYGVRVVRDGRVLTLFSR